MSLMSSMYAGASGLNANSEDLTVIGDNLANASTIGFKASRAAFADALAQSMLNGNQVGMGTRVQAVQRLLAQGSLANTGIATDLALNGPGFFIVKGSNAGADGTFYTRAGQFTVDNLGYLVNLDGMKVQGYPADATGEIQPGVGDLLVGNAASSPSATANITLKGNLKSDAAILTNPFDPADKDSYNFTMDTTIYDSLGKAHVASIYYRKTAAGAWEFHTMTDGAGIQGGTAGTPSEIASGTLTFGTDGSLTDATQTSNFTPVDATSPQALTFNFGTTTTAGGTGRDGITQFAQDSSTSFVNQDGYASGELSSVSIDSEGRVVGAFSNGQTRALGQVALADFSAADKLTRMGGNLYGQTLDSGDPAVGTAGTGGRGGIIAGALEQSNVDMANEFVRMISAQRSFQANSKTISTADQLLAELMSLKR